MDALPGHGAVTAPSADNGDAVWLHEAEQQVWRAYLRAHAELMAHLHRSLQGCSQLSLPDYEVLVRLSEAPDGSARVFELSRSLQWEKSRLSHHLKRMEARGLVDRQTCPTDARGAIVSITAEGSDLIRRAAPQHAADVRRILFEPLTPEQIDTLGEISRRVLNRIAADSGTTALEDTTDVSLPMQSHATSAAIGSVSG